MVAVLITVLIRFLDARLDAVGARFDALERRLDGLDRDVHMLVQRAIDGDAA